MKAMKERNGKERDKQNQNLTVFEISANASFPAFIAAKAEDASTIDSIDMI